MIYCTMKRYTILLILLMLKKRVIHVSILPFFHVDVLSADVIVDSSTVRFGEWKYYEKTVKCSALELNKDYKITYTLYRLLIIGRLLAQMKQV